MATNELITKFTFDSADGERRIDLTRKSLFALHTDLNNLGKNTVVGKTIANDFTEAGRAADQFKNKVNNSLKPPQDNELKKALQDIKRIQLENVANEKLITRAINAESKQQADVKIREIRRADAEARKSANDTLRILNERNIGNINNSSFAGSFVGNLGASAVTELTSAVVSGGRAVLNYSSSLEQARIGLTTMTGSADVAAVHLKDLQNFAKTTPFEFSELVTASQKLQGVGFSAQKVIPILRDVGSSLAASGRISELPFAIKALGDIQAKGKLAGQEIIQLANAGIPAIKILSGALNKSSAEILKLSENGQISSEVFLNALHQYSQSNFGGALEAQSRTFAGAVSNIKDALGQTAEVAFRPIFQKVSNIANDISVEISKNENDLEKVGIAIASNIAKGFGTIIRDAISDDLQNIGQGKSNPTSTYFKIGGVGNDFRKGLLGERGSVAENLESSYNLTFGKYKNRIARDLDQLNLEIRDTETINYFGRLNNELSKLYEERNVILQKIINPDAVQNALTDGTKIDGITYTFDKATNTLIQTADAAKTLTNNLGDAGKEAAKLADSINKFKVSEVDSYLNYGKAEILNNNGGNKSLQTIREIADSEQAAIKEKIRLTKQLTGEQIRALTPEERNGQRGAEISLNAVAQVNDLMRRGKAIEFETQKQIKDFTEQTKLLKSEFNSFAADSISNDNPFIKLFADADSAGERMEKRFKTLGDKYVQLATTIERNNIAKKINDLSYESDKKALTFEQDAFRTDRIRDNRFASFERALDLVERKVDFAVRINQLDRDISENDFYARSYNPNNPRRLEEFARRFIGDDPAIRNSLADVAALRRIDLGATGIAGESAVAGEVLKVLPPLQDLVSALKNPKLSGDARFLLDQRSNALRSVRANEQQKLQDFIYDQETAGLNRKFAYDQLALLNNQTGLSMGEFATRFLDITKGLGNDIDPYLRRGMYEQNLIAAKEERAKQDEAQQYWKDTAQAVADIKKALIQIITANGLKIDGSNLAPTNVYVDAKDFDITSDDNPSRPSSNDVENLFGNIFG